MKGGDGGRERMVEESWEKCLGKASKRLSRVFPRECLTSFNRCWLDARAGRVQVRRCEFQFSFSRDKLPLEIYNFFNEVAETIIP